MKKIRKKYEKKNKLIFFIIQLKSISDQELRRRRRTK
jgi:hypothetical protein